MTKIQVKVVLFCTVFFFATIFLLSGQVWATSGEEVEIEADVLEYDPATGIMNAFGNVKLRQDEITITTSQLFYCREDGMVRTNETVHFQSSTLDLTGEGLWYSLSTREGEIKEVKGQGKEVYFSGRAGIISPDDFTVRDGSYTTCELANPCFNISARKVRIDEEYVKIGFGWLELKGLKVLPLPPLRLPTDMDWPDLEAGYTNERGLFVGVTTEQPVSERVRYSYGGSIGTKKWLSLDAGLTWQAGKVSINTTGSYRINGAHIFNTIWRYTDTWGELSASFYQEWGSEAENIGLLQVTHPFSAKTSGSLFYQIEEWGGIKTHGARISGRWIPGFTIGLGMVHGAGNLEEARLGWHPETSISWSGNLAKTWSLSANATYLWGKGMKATEGVWLSQWISLTKDLHCLAISLNYDFIEEDYGLAFRIKW